MDEPEFMSLVLLANSRKHADRCIAGKSIEDGRWVRPISARPEASVSRSERCYEGGIEPALLDIVEVALLEPQATALQPENWLLDPEWYWTHQGRYAAAKLAALVDRPETLWDLGFSSKVGEHDRIPEGRTRLGSSLALIRASDLEIWVSQYQSEDIIGKVKVRGRFRYRQVTYDLTITDPEIEKQYRGGPGSRARVGDRFLTISVGEPYLGYMYKLIAAVFET